MSLLTSSRCGTLPHGDLGDAPRPRLRRGRPSSRRSGGAALSSTLSRTSARSFDERRPQVATAICRCLLAPSVARSPAVLTLWHVLRAVPRAAWQVALYHGLWRVAFCRRHLRSRAPSGAACDAARPRPRPTRRVAASAARAAVGLLDRRRRLLSAGLAALRRTRARGATMAARSTCSGMAAATLAARSTRPSSTCASTRLVTSGCASRAGVRASCGRERHCMHAGWVCALM